MAKGKYAKYVQKLETLGIKHPEYGKKMREPLVFSERIIPGTQVQVPIQLMCESGCGWGLGLTIECPPDFIVKDLPHSHNVDEVWLFFGTDPKDPHDLGGEIEFWMGEGDNAEKHTITEPSAVLVPKGVVHGPVYYKKVKRPIVTIPILVQAHHVTPNYTEIPAAFEK